ncbi:MAG: BlaI/MecI/CopY family transcriptional regulator [Pirellulaceae bacterium]
MARPKAKELTQRELDIMHVFWQDGGELTAPDVRDRLADQGSDLAYTTVATLVRILVEKECLVQTNEQRPFSYKVARTFDEISGRMLGDVLQRVFQGSREQLLVRLFGQQKKLTASERAALEQILHEQKRNQSDV